jgi:hypothetical protein
MGNAQLKRQTRAYFSTYRYLVNNLKTLYHLHNQRQNPAYRYEVRLLSLAYLDQLAESWVEKKTIGNFMKEFCSNDLKKFPDLVSSGSVYRFCSSLVDLRSSRVEEFVNDRLWKRHSKEFLDTKKEIENCFSASFFKLIMRALGEFSLENIEYVDRQNNVPRKRKGGLYYLAAECDLTADAFVEKFSRFVSRGSTVTMEYAASFGIETKKTNRQRFRELVYVSVPRMEIRRIVELFTFSRILQRDYRNSMVHAGDVIKKGREIGEVQPHYNPVDYGTPRSPNVRDAETFMELNIPDMFLIRALEEGIDGYERYCREHPYNPMPQRLEV